MRLANAGKISSLPPHNWPCCTVRKTIANNPKAHWKTAKLSHAISHTDTHRWRFRRLCKGAKGYFNYIYAKLQNWIKPWSGGWKCVWLDSVEWMEGESFKLQCKQVKSITKTAGNLFKVIKQPWRALDAFHFANPPITRIACNYTPVNCAFAALWIWGCGRTGIWSSVDKSRTMGDCSTRIDLGGMRK